MAKNEDTAVKVPRSLIARFGVTGTKASKLAAVKTATVSPPWDIHDSEALVPGAIAIRVRAKDCATDADLFREVAGCVLHWGRVLGDSIQKESTASAVKHARECAARANSLVTAAQDAVVQSGRPTATQWATLVEAAIHAGSAFTLSVDYVRLRKIRARGSRSANKVKGDATRDHVRAMAEKMPRTMSKSEAARQIGEQLAKTPERISDLLTEMYPGAQWKKRGIG